MAYYNPSGTPLNQLPGVQYSNQNPGTYWLQRLQEISQYGDEAGHTDWQNASALYENFKRLYGREPTQSEINQYVPYYLQDPTLGNAYLEQQHQNDPNLISKNAESKYGDVNDAFKQYLGRDATDAEKKHFGSLLATNQVDPYGLADFIQNTSEYTNKKDEEFRGKQRGELEAADTTYYQDKLLPAIQAQFAQQGRSLDSSGFSSSLAQAAKQQGQEREKYLTGLSASQYQGREGAARSDYEAYINQLYGNQDYGRNRNSQLQDYYLGRNNQIQDFQMQKQAYDDYLSRYGQRKNRGGNALTGAATGAAAGSYFGPWGTAIGGVVGGIGGYFA